MSSLLSRIWKKRNPFKRSGGEEHPSEGDKRADEAEEAKGEDRNKKSRRSGHAKKPLKEQTLEGIAAYILEYPCDQILVLSGAGTSTSSGLPDLRTPPFGLYHSLIVQPQLPYVHALFENRFFKRRPKPLYQLIKRHLLLDCRPSPSHYFVALLEAKGVLLKNYTLNFDGLERKAGVSEEKLALVNGCLDKFWCIRCRREMGAEEVKEELSEVDMVFCACGGIVKPKIHLYGDIMPKKFCNDMYRDFSECDALLILGTSLSDQPVASMPFVVPRGCPRLVVNTDEPRRSLDFRFGEKTSKDVFWQGECDEACVELAALLGWSEDLKQLIADRLNMNV